MTSNIRGIKSLANETPQTFQHKRVRLSRNIMIIAALLFLISIVAIVAYSMRVGTIHPASTPVFGNRVLLNGTITVDADSAYYIEFSVPEGGPNVQVLNIQVSGNFAVSDNNTIRVYVTNGNNFNPNSPDFSPYYDSGLSTKGNINVTLPSGGTYYLVYNNYNYNYNYLQTSDKIVTTQVTLNYTLF